MLNQRKNMTAAALHGQDCVHESCLSPSLGWLSPTRISFSEDFSPHELDARGTVDSMGIKAMSNDTHQYKGKARPSADVRDSMSEFEFAMASLECDQNAGAGRNKHTRGADELFFKGKLLPLYVPQFTTGSTVLRASVQYQADHGNGRSDFDKKALSSSATASSFGGLKNGSFGSMNAKVKGLTGLPTSPKTPRCSSKLRELLGLKKSKALSASSATTSNARHDGVLPSLGSCKALPKSSNNLRSAAMEPKSPLQTLCKAKRLFFRSDEGMNKVLEGRSSTSEPLLTDARGGNIDSFSGQSIGCPVISFRPQHEAHHQQFYGKKNHGAHADHSPSLCGSARNQIVQMQRSNRVSDHLEDLSYLQSLPQQLRVPMNEMKSNENYVIAARSSSSCRKPAMKDGHKTPALYRGSRRSSMQAARYYVGSRESSPARRSSGAVSPAGSLGQWSPGRHSTEALLSCYNTACSSCRGSPGRHSISGATGCFSPGRLSLGAEQQLPAASLEAGHGRLMRARSLERRSSYSPKSLQRKYDQMKAMRQRDVWRPGLERSASYNNVSSVHVAPVLNVPRVCSINRSSRNIVCGHTHAGSHSNNGGGFGLSHLLFSTKSHSSSHGVHAAKRQQSRKPNSSCGRRADYYH